MNDRERVRAVLEVLTHDALQGQVTRESMAAHLAAMLHLDELEAAYIVTALRAGVEQFHSESLALDDPYSPTAVELAAFLGLLIGDRLGFDRAWSHPLNPKEQDT